MSQTEELAEGSPVVKVKSCATKEPPAEAALGAAAQTLDLAISEGPIEFRKAETILPCSASPTALRPCFRRWSRGWLPGIE